MIFFFGNGRSGNDGAKITFLYLLCILFTNSAAHLGCAYPPTVRLMHLSKTSSPSMVLSAHGFSQALVTHTAL